MFRRLLSEEGETWDTVEVQKADPPSDEVLGSYDVRQLALRTNALPCTGPHPVPDSVRRCSRGRPALAPAAGRSTLTCRSAGCR